MPKRPARLLLLPFFFLTLTAGICPPELEDIPPSRIAPSPPIVEASTVVAPISVSLAFLKNELEKAIPVKDGVQPYNVTINGGADQCHQEGISLGWAIERDPLVLTATGGNLSISTNVRYSVSARARNKLPFGFCGPLIPASCGVGEPLRRASVTMTASPAVTNDWRLIAAGASQVNPIDRCTVTIFNIDVTDKVMQTFRDRVRAQAEGLNAKLAAINLRARLADAWATLRTPISLGPGAWLAVQPSALGITPLSGAAEAISVGAFLSARPVVTIGDAPEKQNGDLPNASGVPPGQGFHLASTINVRTEVLTGQLKRLLRVDEGGLRYPATGRFYVRPTEAELYAYGTKVVVRVRFKGSAKGTLYLTGTPTWDAGANVLTVPDLAYTVETANLLLRIAQWTEGNRFRDDLRNRLRLDFSTQVAEAKATAEQALNRTAGPVRLSGTVAAARIVGIYANPSEASVKVIAVADGTARAEIR